MTKISIARRRVSDARLPPSGSGKGSRRVPVDWFELLAETTFDGVGVTQDGVVVEANGRLAAILGYEQHEIVGAPLMRFVAPVHRDLVRGREASGDEDLYEHRALRKDGTIILVEARGRNCTYRGRPARLAVVRDITQAALQASREAEKVLRRAKERLDRAASAGRVALWEWDLAAGTVEWTALVDAMLGFPPGGFPRTLKAWSSQVHPDDADAVVAALDLHLRKDIPYDASYRIRRADGEYVWWHDVGFAERDATGRPFRMAGTCVDVTERMKTAEAIRSRDTALRTSEHWLEEAQRVGRLGWYSYHPGTDVFAVSETVREILGIGAEYPHDTAGWLSLVHPDDRERVGKVLQRGVAGQLTPDLAYRTVRPDDGQVRHIHARASAVFDVSGRVVRILGTIQDETEKKQVEGEIRRLTAAVEQVAQSVVITDTDGTIRYVNAAFTATTGYSRPEALGRTRACSGAGSTTRATTRTCGRRSSRARPGAAGSRTGDGTGASTRRTP